jgi:HAD superfamily hydrolase (TIGR01509 family)
MKNLGEYMSIKYIVCDLGGVYFSDGTKSAVEKIKNLYHADPRTVDELFKSSPRKEGYLFRIGKMEASEYWNVVSKKLDIPKEKIPEVRELWYGAYELDKDVEKIIESLRPKYKVVVFSGNIKERVEYLHKKHGILDKFDNFVFSYDHGLHKGDHGFVEKLLKEIDAHPSECVYIDDKDEYLDMGKRLGMKTILFHDAASLKDDLRKHGVEV